MSCSENWDTVQPMLVDLGNNLKAAYNRATMQTIAGTVEWLLPLSQLMLMRAEFVRVLTELGKFQSLNKSNAHLDALVRAETMMEDGEDGEDVDSTRKKGLLKTVPKPSRPDHVKVRWMFMAEYRGRALGELKVLKQLFVANESIITFDFLGASSSLFVAFSSLQHLSKSMEIKASVEKPTTSQSREADKGGIGVMSAKHISEWWTQMDGYWGVNTTRALQQYLNSQLQAAAKGPEAKAALRTSSDDGGGKGSPLALVPIAAGGGAKSSPYTASSNSKVPGRASSMQESLSVDGNFSKRTITVLQWHINQQRKVYTAAADRADDQSLRANQASTNP